VVGLWAVTWECFGAALKVGGTVAVMVSYWVDDLVDVMVAKWAVEKVLEWVVK